MERETESQIERERISGARPVSQAPVQQHARARAEAQNRTSKHAHTHERGHTHGHTVSLNTQA
eukprot:6196097-Pleurochrysis_carterae.AAC.1